MFKIILIGYDEQRKAYHYYNTFKRPIILNHNAVFFKGFVNQLSIKSLFILDFFWQFLFSIDTTIDLLNLGFDIKNKILKKIQKIQESKNIYLTIKDNDGLSI